MNSNLTKLSAFFLNYLKILDIPYYKYNFYLNNLKLIFQKRKIAKSATQLR